MRSLSDEHLHAVYGGDAAATRPPGTNSWGEGTGGGSDSWCTTVEVGPYSQQVCTKSDGTKEAQVCLNFGIGGRIGPISLGVSISECKTFPLTGRDMDRALVIQTGREVSL